ncbi:acetylcholine receptor subunit alpha-like [Ylistrum balloti]|uniref:acetylcholine receptor subunit alpha-like n=1 Tax=Ylistrum balloti TaxID=509963 RepID=UPI002905F2D1|nr:acetylcholine receptor subunit alpha-like [Ylistrum balloti]
MEVCRISLFFVALASPQVVTCATLEDVVQLHTDLFSNYSTNYVPVHNHTDILNVSAAIYLMNILNIDAVSGVIEMTFCVETQWTDYRLSWTPSSYGGLTGYNLKASYIWHPKIFLLTTAAELESFSGNEFLANAQPSGEIQLITGKLVKSICNVDMTHYPTDTQTCSFVICPWGYTPSEVRLIPSNSTVALQFLSPNGEWDIASTSIVQSSFYEPQVAALQINLTLSRKSTYYMISLIAPIVLLILLSSAAFLIPVSSGGRVSYAISMLLSLALYLSLISASIPQVSEPMAGISYFLTLSLIGSSVLVLLTIFTLRLESIDTLDGYPERFIRVVRSFKNCSFKSKKRDEVENIKTPENNEKHCDNVSLHSSTESVDLTVPEVRSYIDMFLFITSTAVGVIMIIFYFGGYIKN